MASGCNTSSIFIGLVFRKSCLVFGVQCFVFCDWYPVFCILGMEFYFWNLVFARTPVGSNDRLDQAEISGLAPIQHVDLIRPGVGEYQKIVIDQF